MDLHEIVPDISVHDEYSADIYDPGDSFEYMQENVDDNIEEHIENDSYIDLSVYFIILYTDKSNIFTTQIN